MNQKEKTDHNYNILIDQLMSLAEFKLIDHPKEDHICYHAAIVIKSLYLHKKNQQTTIEGLTNEIKDLQEELEKYDCNAEDYHNIIESLKVDLAFERAAHAETRRERDDLRAYAHVATIVITDIAGGGSELFGRQIGDLWTADLDYCNKVIRERRPHKAEVWKERSLKEAAEAQRDEALKALEPFAKAGELFPGEDVDFDQCIYRPAAGDEYALYGNHLRAARRALEGGKADG